MIKECQFEEKQYEQYLNAELVGSERLFYCPGQVFEHYIGIDAAIFSTNSNFWRLFRRFQPFYPLIGVPLTPHDWDSIERVIDDDFFPEMKCNIFIQYKRPEYVTPPSKNLYRSPLKKEYQYWGQAYFRYWIDANQQTILRKLEKKVKPNAIVTYACPSFWTRKELWKYYAERRLVGNSNFVKPNKLDGHQKYTFIKAGRLGKAFSEPEEIEHLDLLKEIKRVMETGERFEKNSNFIEALSTSIMQVVENLDKDYRIGFKKIIKGIKVPAHALPININKIIVFTWLTGISWGVVLQEKCPM